MKIGLVVPGFSADERDWCIPAHLNLARSLAAAHRVHVFALRYPHRRDVYTVKGATVHSLGGARNQGASSVMLWMSALDAIRREHRSARFDILHSIFGGEAGMLTVIASRSFGVPGIVSLVGGELVGIKEIGYGQDLLWRQRILNRIALMFADRVLCGSTRMTQLARSRLPARQAARVKTLPLGVDTRMFAPLPTLVTSGGENTKGPTASEQVVVGGDSVNILNVGSLIPVKDHATLIKATAEFIQERPQVRLRIVGTGMLERQLRALVSELEIADRVDFAGGVRHDQLPSVYRWGDLYVQSSRHEGEGMAVLEAAASGIPLAGSDVGVLSDLAVAGAGIVVPPGDANALANAMNRAVAARRDLGPRARNVIQSQYELEGTRERLEQVYHSARNG